MQRTRSGDSTAENELFQKYKDPILWKICRRLQTDRENIKDLAGEIYVAILEGLRNASFQPDKWESLEAYIWGVTNNKIRDWLKSAKIKFLSTIHLPIQKSVLSSAFRHVSERIHYALKLLRKAYPKIATAASIFALIFLLFK